MRLLEQGAHITDSRSALWLRLTIGGERLRPPVNVL